jgi:hypothetical protein
MRSSLIVSRDPGLGRSLNCDALLPHSSCFRRGGCQNCSNSRETSDSLIEVSFHTVVIHQIRGIPEMGLPRMVPRRL